MACRSAGLCRDDSGDFHWTSARNPYIFVDTVVINLAAPGRSPEKSVLMHEFSLVQSILSTAQRLAEEHGGAPIERIVVDIGALQQVVPEALTFAFDAAREETLAADAQLEWHEVVPLIECPSCGIKYETADVFWSCPDCGAPGGRAIRGDELVLRSITLKETAGVGAESRESQLPETD